MSKRKAVLISDELNQELLGQPVSVTALARMLHTSEQMVDALRSRRLVVNKMTTLERITSYYFVHSYNVALSTYVLAKDGLHPACIILSRSLLECLIDLAYLWQCKKINGKDSDEREAWMQQDAVDRNAMAEMWKTMNVNREKVGLPRIPEIFEHEWATELARRKVEFRQKYGRKDWAYHVNPDTGKRENRHLLSRAQAVDATKSLENFWLEEDYIQTYKWASRLVHGSSSGAQDYMHEDVDKVFMQFGPTGRDLGGAAATARFLLGLLDITNRVLNLNIDLHGQLVASGLPAGAKSG